MNLEKPMPVWGLATSEGFRFFFLAAGVFSVVAMTVWLGWLGIHAAGGVLLYVPFVQPPHQWHAHEMIYGYGGAVLAGFFLTAVPNWSGSGPFAAGRVTLLAAVWAAGRLAMLFSTSLPAAVVAVADLALMPALAATVFPLILKRPKPRDIVIVSLLVVMIAGNTAIHLAWLGFSSNGAEIGAKLGVLTLAAMIAAFGGRVTPMFTRNALTAGGEKTHLPIVRDRLDALGIASAFILALAAPFVTGGIGLSVIAAIAAIANAGRLAGWRTNAILDRPIVWSLHLGFAMLAAGYAALAVHWAGGPIGQTAALHLLAIGAIGGMTLAVMSRAALGHTGRPLVVSPAIAWAYALVGAAALVRSLGLAVFPNHYYAVMFLAGGLWIAAFLLFCFVYAPILLAPRTANPG